MSSPSPFFKVPVFGVPPNILESVAFSSASSRIDNKTVFPLTREELAYIESLDAQASAAKSAVEAVLAAAQKNFSDNMSQISLARRRFLYSKLASLNLPANTRCAVSTVEQVFELELDADGKPLNDLGLSKAMTCDLDGNVKEIGESALHKKDNFTTTKNPLLDAVNNLKFPTESYAFESKQKIDELINCKLAPIVDKVEKEVRKSGILPLNELTEYGYISSEIAFTAVPEKWTMEIYRAFAEYFFGLPITNSAAVSKLNNFWMALGLNTLVTQFQATRGLFETVLEPPEKIKFSHALHSSPINILDLKYIIFKEMDVLRLKAESQSKVDSSKAMANGSINALLDLGTKIQNLNTP